MKNINELDVASILKNLAGDTARNVLTSIPGVGTAVGIGASVKNYSELNDDLEKYKEFRFARETEPVFDDNGDSIIADYQIDIPNDIAKFIKSKLSFMNERCASSK